MERIKAQRTGHEASAIIDYEELDMTPEEYAKDFVCHGKEPQTLYERNMVKTIASLIVGFSHGDDDYQRGLNDGLEQAAFTCKLQIKDWSPTENAKYVALETARDIERAIRAQIKK